MRKAFLVIVGPLLILIIAFAVLASRTSPEEEHRMEQDYLKRKREAFLDKMRHDLNSYSSVRLDGPDMDVLVVDVAGCNRAGLEKMYDIPDVRDVLKSLRIASVRCMDGRGEITIVW